MAQTERAGGISNDAVKSATGKGWDDWFAILDTAGGLTRPHKEMALYLSEEHNVPDWWCQMVVVGYEQERGLRAKHQTLDGYEASVSRTFNAPVEALYDAWANQATRASWLPDPLTVRKSTRPKSLRITWADGTDVDVNLYAKGESKSQISLQHTKLHDAEAVASAKSYWRDAFERLKDALSG